MKVSTVNAQRSDGSGEGVSQLQIRALWAYDAEGQKVLGDLLRAACSPFPSLEMPNYEHVLFAAYHLHEYRCCTDEAWKMIRRIKSDHSTASINCELGKFDPGDWSPGWCGEIEEGVLTLRASGGREVSLYIESEGKNCPEVIITADYTANGHEPSMSSVDPLLRFFLDHEDEVE